MNKNIYMFKEVFVKLVFMYGWGFIDLILFLLKLIEYVSCIILFV